MSVQSFIVFCLVAHKPKSLQAAVKKQGTKYVRPFIRFFVLSFVGSFVRSFFYLLNEAVDLIASYFCSCDSQPREVKKFEKNSNGRKIVRIAPISTIFGQN